jgi:uncharacterized 2Fe-2S/4Fe-4S cluster protein (DUF4445 family)
MGFGFLGGVGTRPEDGNGVAAVSFWPDGQVANVVAGTPLLTAAAMAGVLIDAPCGDRGVCGKCKVRAARGLSALTEVERQRLLPEEREGGWRLACQARVVANAEVHVPRGALKIVQVGRDRPVPLNPNVRKVALTLSPPTVEDQRSHLSRLRDALARPEAGIGLGVIRRLAELLRGGMALTAVMAGDTVIAVEEGDTRAHAYGVAFDIGTTTVVGVLVDLTSGRELAVAADANEQLMYGADVISRINFAATDASGLQKLQQRIVAVLNRLIRALTEKAGVSAEWIYEATVVGNTCMSHLFLKLDPTALALAPYVAVSSEALVVKAGELGLHLGQEVPVYVLPNVASFVGSDTVAVVLATGMHQSKELKLAMDIGTNGEIVLGSRDGLVCCSTAAGPAFEGMQISCGMRGTDGAIERVFIADDVVVQVIGGGQPLGICGSGLIDALAELYRARLIDERGRMRDPRGADEVGNGLGWRLSDDGGGRSFTLGDRNGATVALTQLDIRQLQLAKGAMQAGTAVLLRELGCTWDDVKEVYLAGAFGSYIRPESARAIGLLPSLPLEQLTPVGNAAMVGARLALTSVEARREAEEIARRMRHVELSAREDFQEAFMQGMSLPSPVD